MSCRSSAWLCRALHWHTAAALRTSYTMSSPVVIVVAVLLSASSVLANPMVPCADPATTPSPPFAAPPAPRPTYTTKYDNINVDMIIKNEIMLKAYMDCLMDRKPCTKEGKLLKEIIPDALRTECSGCSPKQKEQAGHILAYLLQYKKNYWNQLISKYDPEGIFRKKYEVDEEEEEEDDEED